MIRVLTAAATAAAALLIERAIVAGWPVARRLWEQRAQLFTKP